LGFCCLIFWKRLYDHYPLFMILTVAATGQCILLML
jgi:hypothetical protein